jgi:hypothetical protein
MPTDFLTLVSAPPSGRDTAVVIDHQIYARAIILQGKPIPWADPVAYAQFLAQAQGLLQPDTTLIDLGARYDHALAEDATLRCALSTRSRVGYALKTLLADEKHAAAAAELTIVVAQTSAAPVVLQIPSPLLWLARTHELSGAGSAADLSEHDVETAAMYVAGWLRKLSGLPIAMLLLDERWTGPGELPPIDTSVYSPVANVAEHYRWILGQRTNDGVTVTGSAVHGAAVPADYWLSESVAAPSGDFLVADIPAHAVPETVLTQLAKLA